MYNIKLSFYWFIFLTLTLVRAEPDQWIQKVVDLTINNKFGEALEIAEKKIEQNPKDFRAQFYLAATLSSEMTHSENLSGSDRFQQAIDSTISLIDPLVSSDQLLPDTARAELLFYLGSAYGYRAFFEGNNGQWLPAISNGLKSVGYLSESLEHDSLTYGAYLGIGVYKYWRYSRLGIISWLPFIPDDRDEGIMMILQAIAYDSLSRYMAMHQLVYILLDYDKKEEALYYADEIVKKYPQSQFMWWANAHAYLKNEIYDKAKSAYITLLRLIEEDENRNISHVLKCDFKLALIFKEQKNYKLSIERCYRILERSKNYELNENSQDTVSRTEDLLEECIELINE